MATCKDCVHVEVCCSYLSTAYNKCKLATPDFEQLKNIECDECQHFKDRSRFVELLCKPGDIVYHYCEELHEILNYTVYIINVFSENSIIYRADSYDEENEEALSEIEFESKDIGKTVFLIKEQAEQALRERESK